MHIRLVHVILLTAVAAAFVLPMAAVAQQEPGTIITTDKTTYIDPTDRFVHVTATGLDACAGETVTVGLFTGAGDLIHPASIREAVPVAGDGTLSADVPVPWEQSSTTASAGVRADCVPGGVALGEQLTFMHSDPPFGPVLPAAPLPPGVTISTGRGTYDPGDTALVTVTGFEQCAGRALVVHLATEAGGPVFADPNRDVTATGSFDGNSALSAALSLEDVPTGRYIVWVRSVCTGTLVAPGGIEVSSSGPLATATPAPAPPSVGTGTQSGDTFPTVLGVALVLAVASLLLLARRRTSPGGR
ncbi:MAG: hypothetical protein M0R74_14785 [Dehalococcoidia bacterium]|nr:hypothetical protein [Dehalococcoidia bacterium]